MNRILKIDSVMYQVKDLDMAARFYEKVLGLKKAWTDKKAGMIGFLCEKNETEVVISNTSIPEPGWCFSVENVEDYCREFEKEGHVVLTRPFNVRCGKFAILQDPDGNKIPIIDLTKFNNVPRFDK
jgi:lactoylglutathione lyase